MPRIAIIGGGLVGRLTALQLAEQGFQTALFDRASRRRAIGHLYAAAMLAPFGRIGGSHQAQVVALGRQSLPMWQALVRRFNTSGAYAAGRQPDGVAPGKTSP